MSLSYKTFAKEFARKTQAKESFILAVMNDYCEWVMDNLKKGSTIRFPFGAISIVDNKHKGFRGAKVRKKTIRLTVSQTVKEEINR